MQDYLSEVQRLHTLFSFIAFVFLLSWESVFPFFSFFKNKSGQRLRHSITNLFFGLFNSLMIGSLFFAMWIGASIFSESTGVGLLHHLDLVSWQKTMIVVLIMDFWTYWWHRLNHEIPFLWRFHRVHHSDMNMDVTTSFRFHMGEIALSSILRIPIIFLIGCQVWQIVTYEALMFLIVQFHHANVAVPPRLDKALRALIVTPDMHKVHHSIEWKDLNSNYTSFFSLWDRLFGTFRILKDTKAIRFGVKDYENPEQQDLAALVKSPID
jgi:sterol desaturase/sphingolipid hydroxylase (fatty acid hydroxylase superfamily)